MGLEERFWTKARVGGPDECWEWTASLKNGYGQINVDGSIKYAHRISWLLKVGPLPQKGKELLHSCDNRKCINPNHLRIGTRKENILDMRMKGRHPTDRQTHCKRGHPLSGDNLYATPASIKYRYRQRICRSCVRLRSRIWIARKRSLNS